MSRSIEQSPWEAYEALIESIMKNADHDFWDSGSDIEAVAYVRHLEGEVERLREALTAIEADSSALLDLILYDPEFATPSGVVARALARNIHRNVKARPQRESERV